jgi:hypothetical protein
VTRKKAITRNQDEEAEKPNHSDEKNPVNDEKDSQDKNQESNYYQCLNEDEGDEGFIEVYEECKNEETNYLGDNLKNQSDNGNANPPSDMDGLEFCEDKQEPIEAKKLEPVQNADKIKNAMKSISMNPPKWAQKYVFYIKNTHLNDSKLT